MNKNVIYIGAVIMDKNNNREYFRRAILKLDSTEYLNSGFLETSEIQKISKYIFGRFVSRPYQYVYSTMNEDCCWIEIPNNTTGLIFILSRDKNERKSDDNTLNFTDLKFDDCYQLVFNWLTDCEAKIEIAPPTPKEILLDYISKKSAVIRKKVMALLPLLDNGYKIYEVIRLTKQDVNSDEIIEALNYYNDLKQNENK